MTLEKYIENHFDGNKSEFAKAQNVHRQQVTRWVNEGFIVVSGQLFSPRRQLKNNGSKDV